MAEPYLKPMNSDVWGQVGGTAGSQCGHANESERASSDWLCGLACDVALYKVISCTAHDSNIPCHFWDCGFRVDKGFWSQPTTNI